jgi:hypothetical protein
MSRAPRTDSISVSRHHDAFRARRLVAGGSLGDGLVHSIDRAPTSWLALAAGLLTLVALVAAVVFVL